MSLVSPFSGHGVHDVPEHVNSKGKFNLFLGTPPGSAPGGETRHIPFPIPVVLLEAFSYSTMCIATPLFIPGNASVGLRL